MKIGADISCLATDNWTGVQNLVNEQLKALIKCNPSNKWVLFALCPKKKVVSFSKLSLFSFKNVKKIIIPVPARMWIPILKLWQRWQFPPVNLFIGTIDVFFSPAWFFLPSNAKVKTAFLFDFFFLKFPKTKGGQNKVLEIRRLRKVAKLTDLMIAISKATKKDAQKFLGVQDERLMVAYPGVNEVFKVKKEKHIINKTLSNFGLTANKYFLCVGGFIPRKNLQRVIQAFLRLEENKNKWLVIVGNKKKTRKKFPQNVLFLSRVSNRQLAALYEGAIALLFPSLDEGFGLPILEAYSSGSLVITSNTSSMPEVAGEAGILVEPKDVLSITTAIKKALSLSPQKRKLLIKKGQKQVSKFSYEKSAAKIMKRLEKLLKEKNENCCIP